MRQPLLLLALLALAGFGTYRAFKFGVGRKRYWGIAPPVLVVLGGLLAPLIAGIVQGARQASTGVASGGNEVLLVVIAGALVLAATIGGVLTLLFRPGP